MTNPTDLRESTSDNARMMPNAQIGCCCEQRAVNTQMRFVYTSATESEKTQDRFVCSSQMVPCHFIDETCKAKRKNCSIILSFEREETIQNFLARSTSSPQNAAAPQQRNQSVHNDPEKNIDWNDTATSSSQLCRENSSTRNRRTTKLISQTFKAEQQQQKKNQHALTNRATFGWAVKAWDP